jgi:hypothetical protein
VTTELAPHYLINADGKCFYPIPYTLSADAGPTTGKAADGWIDVRRADSGGGPGYSHHRATWLITAEPVTAFAFPQVPVKKVVYYRLKDETAASERFPVSLTPQEYNAKREAEDPDDDGAGLTYVMYRPITEEVARDPHVIDVSVMTPLKGEGDANGSWGWEVERTAGLLYGQWYHHLLPGTLHGVADRLARAIEAKYGKHDFFAARTGFNIDSHGNFNIRMNLPFDVPVFKTSPRYGARGQKLRGTQKIQEFVPLAIEWKQGSKISADTKAEAVAIYNQVEADTLAWIESHNLTVCSHCRGNGYTKTSVPKP